MFTEQKNKRAKFLADYKHACVVITVMALPLLKNEVLGSTKDSAKEYITERI